MQELPTELNVHVLLNISHEKLISISSVSSQYRKLCSSDYFWKRKFEQINFFFIGDYIDTSDLKISDWIHIYKIALKIKQEREYFFQNVHEYWLQGAKSTLAENCFVLDCWLKLLKASIIDYNFVCDLMYKLFELKNSINNIEKKINNFSITKIIDRLLDYVDNEVIVVMEVHPNKDNSYLLDIFWTVYEGCGEMEEISPKTSINISEEDLERLYFVKRLGTIISREFRWKINQGYTLRDPEQISLFSKISE